jgi:hypothetical protein
MTPSNEPGASAEKPTFNRDEWYGLEYWEEENGQFEGHTAVRLVATEDRSGSYETESAHIFELDRMGGFAFVTESGFSCYEAHDAECVIYLTEADAKAALASWVKDFEVA